MLARLGRKTLGLALVSATLLLSGCLGQQVRDDLKSMEKTNYATEPAAVDDGKSPFPDVPLVSLSDLVCSPEQYDGREVRVQGITLIERRCGLRNCQIITLRKMNPISTCRTWMPVRK